MIFSSMFYNSVVGVFSTKGVAYCTSPPAKLFPPSFIIICLQRLLCRHCANSTKNISPRVHVPTASASPSSAAPEKASVPLLPKAELAFKRLALLVSQGQPPTPLGPRRPRSADTINPYPRQLKTLAKNSKQEYGYIRSIETQIASGYHGGT